MTARERATKIVRDNQASIIRHVRLIEEIEQAIIAAEEAGAKEEREACAMIADEMKAELSQRPEKLQYGRTQIEVAEYIASEIRARSQREGGER